MIYFEWDEEKSRTNRAKHGLTFRVAETVFQDLYRVTEPDSVVEGEERWRTIGMTPDGTLVLVVIHLEYADQSDLYVRIISARRALPFERKGYEHNRS